MTSLAPPTRGARSGRLATRPKAPTGRAAVLLGCLCLIAACEAEPDGAPRRSPDSPSDTSSPEGRSVPVRQSFHMEVPAPPVPVPIGGTRRLVYELHLLNFASGPLTVERVEILDAADGTVLTELSGEVLGDRLSSLASPSPEAGAAALGAGTLGIVYLEIDLEDDVPRALEHRVRYRDEGEDAPALALVQGARTPVRSERPVVLSPPVRGGPWVAVYHPSWERGHRRVVYAIGGRAHIPGRFAVDWFKVDSLGRHAGPTEDRVSDWYGHGADALAVADGVVVSVRTDVAESATVSDHTRPTLADASGNYVVLVVGEGRYAFYEHLQPGSIRVRPGDRVTRGQVIAQLGFTGSATGPHLHFHVADADVPLAAEGLPFVLDAFEVLGSYAASDLMTGVAWRPADGASGGPRTDELPAPNAVVVFDPGGS